MQNQIMYVEYKGDCLTGPARIGRVTFSNTGKTLHYADKAFRSLKGDGYKANYCDIETGEHYWISGCKKQGDDTLYPGTIEIDDDVREEYWCDIRGLPDCVHQSSCRSEGKYSKRKPK